MTAIMVRLCSDCTGALLRSSFSGSVSKPVIVVSNPQWQTHAAAPNQSSRNVTLVLLGDNPL